MSNSIQEVLGRLCDFWGNLGCLLISPAQTELSSPLFHPSTFFEMIDDSRNYDIMYFQPHLSPKEFKSIKYGVQNYSLLKFQIVMKSEIEMPQQIFMDSLSALDIDLKNNELTFRNKELDDFTFGLNAHGYNAIFNSKSLARIYYIQNVGCGESESTPLTICYNIDKILMVLQNVDNLWDVKWDGKNISYGDMNFVSEKENYVFLSDNSTNEEIFKEFENHRNTAGKLLENKIIIPAYLEILKARSCLDILNFRNFITYNNKIQHNKSLRELINMCCSLYITNRKGTA